VVNEINCFVLNSWIFLYFRSRSAESGPEKLHSGSEC